MKQVEALYNAYFHDVYLFVKSLSKSDDIAEEITQETFFKALRSIDQFDGRCKVYVWLCQIAKNTYFTHYQRSIKSEKFSHAPQHSESLDEQIANQETAFEIHKILHTLPDPYKEVFSLRAFGELSFRQIGELFGKTESWARVTYHRAKMRIKEELQ